MKSKRLTIKVNVDIPHDEFLEQTRDMLDNAILLLVSGVVCPLGEDTSHFIISSSWEDIND